MPTTTPTIETIMESRLSGERDGTYAMLMQLVASKQVPECLNALEKMVSRSWRDVRGFIRYFEENGDTSDADTAIAVIQGCVRMTTEQLRKDHAACRQSWAAKWVPREPKCRASPLLRWYYDALAEDMFPGEPDAKRRFRKLITALSPTTETIPGLVHMVRQAERATTSEQVQRVNALWQRHLNRFKRATTATTLVVPALSLAHSMGPGHNNCLHAGIGMALHFLHLSSCTSHILTFSSHAEWRELASAPDFVSQVQQLMCAARSPINGLNANVNAIINAPIVMPPHMPISKVILLIISDMEHDDDNNSNTSPCVMTWNVSRNGRAASFHGDNPCAFEI
jgi:hypothetical protein